MIQGRPILYKGKKHQIGKLAKKFNLDAVTLADRIYKHKWPIEKALKTPPKPQMKSIDYNEAVELYFYVMRRFYTKQHRLLSYKALISEMKVGVKRIDTEKQKEILTKHKKTYEQREVLRKHRSVQKNFEVSDRWNMRLVG
jgi:hypothetical protein